MKRHLPIGVLLFTFVSACQVQQPTSPSRYAKLSAPSRSVTPTKPNWNSRLLSAAKAGDYDGASEPLRHDASPNAREDRQTPLLWAAFYGHGRIADFLVQHGADVDAVDRFGQTPLSMAERQHRDDMISFLISHGATKR